MSRPASLTITVGGLVAAGLVSAALAGCSSSASRSPGSVSVGLPTSARATSTPARAHRPESIAACESDKKDVEIAVEAYYATHGRYPRAIDDAAHSPDTLVGGGFLREAPTATLAIEGFVIGYHPTATGYTITPASCR